MKMEDITKKGKEVSLRTLARGVVGTARSMGIEVYNPREQQQHARVDESAGGAVEKT